MFLFARNPSTRARPARSRPAASRRFAADIRGTTAIEFALVAVPFLGLLASILDTGLGYYAERNLDAAAQGAARQIRIGAVQAANITNAKDYVNNYVCPKQGSLIGSLIDCSKLIVDVRTASAFTGNDLSNSFYKTPSTNQFCLGAPSQITVIRIAYPMPWFVPVVSYGPLGIAANHAGLVNDVPSSPGVWMLLVTSVSIVRTEPYPQSQYTQQQGC